MVTLNIWFLGSGGGVKESAENEVDAFKEKFPGLKIKAKIIPWRDAWGNIVKAANEQKGPDILQIGSTWNATLAYLGVLRDITQEVCDANIAGDFFIPAAWNNCYFPGSARISSLPWFADIRAIYYRNDIFRDIGLSTDGFNDWASFEQTCKTIESFKESRLIEVFGAAGQKETILLQNIAPWFWGGGGDFLTSDGKHADFNNKKALAGIEFYISLISKGYIPLSALNLKTEDINIEFFSRGNYAIAVPGLLDSDLVDPNNPLCSAKIIENCISSCFPAGPAGRFVFCGGSNLAITSFSQHPKEAWKFIKFLTSCESQIRYTKRRNRFPCLLECFDLFFTDENPLWKGLRDSWRYTRAFPNVPAWGAIEVLLVECFGKIFSRIQEGNYDFYPVRRDLDITALDVDDLLRR